MGDGVLELAAALRRHCRSGRRTRRSSSTWEHGECSSHAPRTCTATCTAGGTRRPSSCARPRSGSPGMDEVPGYHGHEAGGAAARHSAARRGSDAVLSCLGQGATARDDRQPSRLDAVAPAPVGCTRCLFSCIGRAASCIRAPRSFSRRSRSAWSAGHRGLAEARAEDAARRRCGALRESERHARRVVRLRRHALHRAARLARRGAAPSRRTSTSKVRISTAAGSIRRCSSRA
jgi:hypothetical protein